MPPAVANHVLYMGNGTLRAYDARGVTNCSGTPKVCSPLWASANTQITTAPAVANGLVYAAERELQVCDIICTYTRRVLAFDAAGSANCSPEHVCAPIWHHDETVQGEGYGDPVVANGVLYVNDFPINSSSFSFPETVHAFTLP